MSLIDALACDRGHGIAPSQRDAGGSGLRVPAHPDQRPVPEVPAHRLAPDDPAVGDRVPQLQHQAPRRSSRRPAAHGLMRSSQDFAHTLVRFGQPYSVLLKAPPTLLPVMVKVLSEKLAEIVWFACTLLNV